MSPRWVAALTIVTIVLLVAVAVSRGGAAPGPGLTEASGATSQPSILQAPDDSGKGAPSAFVSPAPTKRPIATPSLGAQEPLDALLAMLRVASESRIGYTRSLFVHWIDGDGDGCDTRHEVLIDEAIVHPSIGPGCSLTGGKWFSSYDDQIFTDPADLQIDHVVALAEAWDSGASAWTPARRESFANDLDGSFVLIAVSGQANQSKSDKDPADWLPPAPAAECPFLGAWIATKVRWDLAVDPRERDALVRDIAADCGSMTMPYLPMGSVGEDAAEATGPGASDAPGGLGSECDPAYPTVCIAPPPPDLDCADVQYRNFAAPPPDPHRFDGDGDGVGCET